jgi:integrase
MSIEQRLLENRPTLGASSIKTYESNLRNMYIKIFGKEDIDLEKFNDVEKFKELLKDVDPKTRKGKYSALFILTNLEEYQDLMMDDIEVYNENKGKREMNDKQKDTFVSQEEIHEKMAEMRPKVDTWFKQKNLPKLQDFLILCLYGGYYIPPRRSMDYTLFKLRNIDDNQDNFLQQYTKDKKLHGRLVFNEFKTKKRGQDVVEIPTDLLSILRKWKRTHGYDYLFFTAKGEPINSSVMNQRVERIFGKKVGINGFRHSYMTDKYGHMIENEKMMAEDFRQMGSSVGQRDVYITTA